MGLQSQSGIINFCSPQTLTTLKSHEKSWISHGISGSWATGEVENELFQTGTGIPPKNPWNSWFLMGFHGRGSLENSKIINSKVGFQSQSGIINFCSPQTLTTLKSHKKSWISNGISGSWATGEVENELFQTRMGIPPKNPWNSWFLMGFHDRGWLGNSKIINSNWDSNPSLE